MGQVIRYGPLDFESAQKLVSDPALAKMTPNPKTVYFGAWIGEELAACAGLKVWSKSCESKSAFVKPEYRGKGLFKGLLDIRVSHARLRRLKVLYALCTPMSEREYLRRGAETVYRTKRFHKLRLPL